MRTDWGAEMRVSKRLHLQLRLTNAGLVVLFLAAVGLVAWLSREYHVQFDWTRSGRNTLSAASIGILERLDKPVTLTAFVSERKDVRTSIRNLVTRYQNVKPDIRLEFINPDTEPTRTRKAGIQYDGELLIEYEKGRETLQRLSEETLTNALARLSRGSERLIVFLGGHGERRPDKQGNHDLSEWADQLGKRGLSTQTLVLGENRKIPQATSVLVIAGPQTNLLAGEVKQIRDYISQGGNLLWLAEAGGLHGLEPVAEMLGLEFEPGVIVDPASQAITGQSATFTVVASYGTHPIVKGFGLMTLFPEAAAIRVNAPEGWAASVFLDTLPSAWAETGDLRATVRFDPGEDSRGPLNLGVALSRDREKTEQRVAVLGDGDFLSNSYLGTGGNLDLGMNLANWVTHDDAYINIPARIAPDLTLSLSRTWLAVIAFGFMIALPIGLVGTGVVIWLRRRKR